MATFNFFNSWKERITKDVNLGSDTFTLALCATANAPSAANAVLADLTQIAYTNFGSRDLTITSAVQTGGVLKFIVADKTLTVSGGAGAAFQYIVIYDNTLADDGLVGWLDYGSALTLADGEQLVINFDDVNGLFDLT